MDYVSPTKPQLQKGLAVVVSFLLVVSLVGGALGTLVPQTALAATTSTLNPNGQGFYTAWTGNENDVDESGTPDCDDGSDGDDNVAESTTGDRESVLINLSSIPDGSTITSVDVQVTYRNGNGGSDDNGTFQTFTRLNGTDLDSGTNIIATDTTCTPGTQTINVADTVKSGATTLEIGVLKTANDTSEVYVGTIRAVVTYTEPIGDLSITCNSVSVSGSTWTMSGTWIANDFPGQDDQYDAAIFSPAATLADSSSKDIPDLFSILTGPTNTVGGPQEDMSGTWSNQVIFGTPPSAIFATLYHASVPGNESSGDATCSFTLPPQCSDGLNNDPSEDLDIDWPDDLGCTDASDNSESPNPVIPPTLTLQKTTTNDNGGTAIDTDWTLTATGPETISGEEGDASITGATVVVGSYDLSESGPAGYSASAWVCTGTGTQNDSDTVTLAAGQNATCTITNTDNAPSLTLVKVVTNDNGGPLLASSVTLTATGPTGFSGVGPSVSNGASFDIGSYNLSESAVPGYTPSDWVCVGGTQNDSDTVTLGLGQSATCTITNDDIAPTIKVFKTVTNDNGGEAVATGFSFLLDSIVSLIHNIAAQTTAGAHTVSEVSFFGYAPSSWGGDCAANGSITLALGQNATCSITNDDIAPTLTLEKTVVTLDGGTATEADFQGRIDGSDVAWDTPIVLNAGAHTASEVAGVSGYSPSAWGGDCATNGTITLAPGDQKTCTITNDDIAPGLTLKKVVTTDNGGNEDVPDFQGYIDDDPVDWNDAQPLIAGTYTLSEDGLSGYSPSSWSCTGGSLSGDEITIGVGETVECTITNDDIAPTITLVKDVTNDNGGDAGENDFGLSIGGALVDSEETLAVDANIPIEITELGLTGYSFVSITGEGCPTELGGTVNLNEGEDLTCTITNDDDVPSLILVKEVINDDGGDASASSWMLTATGPTPISGEGGASSNSEFEAGTYALSEEGPEGYAASAWSCEGGSQEGDSVAIALGDEVTCTITNDDSPAVLTIVKNTVGGDGTFDFNVTDGEFSTSPSIETSSGTGSSDVGLDVGTYSVTEDVPSGWTLTSVSCVIGESIENGEQISVGNGDQVTCTFTNTIVVPPPAEEQDVCPNLEGTQTSVPNGFHIDSGLDCIGGSTGNGGGGGGGFFGNPNDLFGGGGSGGGSVAGASIVIPQVLGETCGFSVDQYLRSGGARNNPDQVKKLQEFLNTHGFGSFNPTGNFGPLTLAAVNAFQMRYADEILKPWNLSRPTGLVYLTTLRQMNLIECPDLVIPIPNLIPWSANPSAQ